MIHSKPYLNKNWLIKEHIKKGRTLKSIGKQFNTSGENIGQIARRRGIKIQDKRKWTQKEISLLIKLSKNKTFKNISLIINKSYSEIRRKGTELKIESIYNPALEPKKTKIRKKISATLQNISVKEWKSFTTTRKNNSKSITYKIRHSKEYLAWKKTILKRDDYTCLKCESKDRVQADHIKAIFVYPELACQLDNGQTLCYDCHKEKNILDLAEIVLYRKGQKL